MFCEKCGKQIEEGVLFCGNCGTKVHRENQNQQEEYNVAEEIVNDNFSRRIDMKSFWKYLLLGLITCGIYSIYYMWHTTKDINEICKGDGKQSRNYIVVILLSLLTLGIYGMYWYYIQGKRLYEISPKYDAYVKENGMTYLIWIIFLSSFGQIVATYLLLNNLNKCIVSYNSGMKKNCPSLTQKASTSQKVLVGVAVAFNVIVVISILAMNVAAMAFLEGDLNDTSVSDAEQLQIQEEPVEAHYVLPTSGSEYLEYGDLKDLDEWGCALARNEIYARHGRAFNDDKVQDYFNEQSWYKATVSPDDFDDSVLNIYEKANIELIVDYEIEMGYREDPNEKVYELDSIDELYICEDGLDKKVSVSGPVDYEGDLDSPLLMYSDYSDAEVYLEGLTGADMPSCGYLKVVGTVGLDEFDNLVIYVESYI